VSMKRRIEGLEARVVASRADEEGRVSREAMRLVTDEDLRLLHAYLKRAVEEGGEPTEEEEAANPCYEEIKEEVRHERTAPH
jgi:hypothetical protein